LKTVELDSVDFRVAGAHADPIWKRYQKNRFLLLLMLPAIVFTIVFDYIPMYGVLIAFKQFRVLDGVWGSPWVGFANFATIFQATNDFATVLKNTVIISLYRLIFGFPAPIVLALLFNEIRQRHFKKITQTISYLPHFLSWVILAGLFTVFLSPSTGVVNQLIQFFGGDPIYFLASKQWFRSILIATGIWQSVGWGTIVYLAAIAGIDPQLYEAAKIDGANRFGQALHITLPSITNVMVIMLLFQLGSVMNAGFDQIFNMFNPAVMEVADILDTYVYRVGLVEGNYSFATAVGLFKSVIGLVLVVGANALSRKVSEHGIW